MAWLRLLIALSVLALAAEARGRRLRGDGSVQAAVLGDAVPKIGFGWAASLHWDDGDGFSCTGSLIASNLVVTAAHCLFDGDHIIYKPDKVRIGSYDLTKPGGVEFKIKKVIIHPEYDDTNNDSEGDIALVVLSGRSTATPIKLATTAMVKALKNQASVYSVGYSNGKKLTTLRRFPTRYNNLANCTARLGEDPGITARSLCTGPPLKATGQGVCDGDSGGPLVIGASPPYTLLGTMVQAGEGLCSTGRSSVEFWSSVAYFQPWIAAQHAKFSG